MPFDLAPAQLVWAGAAVVTALLGVAYLAGRRPRVERPLQEKVRAHAGGVTDPDIDRMLEWLPGSPRAGERRRAERRRGRLTRIRVAEDTDAEAPGGCEALVLDRSTGGLCFASNRPFEEGAEVFVRAEAAPVGSPWVGVVVRHCRDQGDHFLVGCQFHSIPPWGVLLLFG